MMSGAKNIFTPALDRPTGAVEAVCLGVRVKCPEVRGDQRVLQARPIARRQRRLAALGTGELRRTIEAREPDLIAEPGDAQHGIAVERAIPGKAVDFGPPTKTEGHLTVTQRAEQAMHAAARQRLDHV